MTLTAKIVTRWCFEYNEKATKQRRRYKQPAKILSLTERMFQRSNIDLKSYTTATTFSYNLSLNEEIILRSPNVKIGSF